MIVKDNITGKYVIVSSENMNKKAFFLGIIKKTYGVDINVSSQSEVDKIKNNIDKHYNKQKS
jgi:NMD protein affecting ribosome stability and mRNA decay